MGISDSDDHRRQRVARRSDASNLVRKTDSKGSLPYRAGAFFVWPAFLLSPKPAFAQGGSILGHVADPPGNVLPHAIVSLTSAKDKSVQQARTGNEGQLSFSGVATGEYFLKVVVAGFEPG